MCRVCWQHESEFKICFHICQELVDSTIRQKNLIHKRLNYLTKFYSSMTVELLRFKGLMVKERSLRQDVFGSRFFHDVSLSEIMATKSIMSLEEEEQLKQVHRGFLLRKF